ncbi:MAG TPA: hypothetical protein VN451_07905 [Chitinophagaceae bacterium]|nr:hypothetical protein [Chitinophagaceae bacterium]
MRKLLPLLCLPFLFSCQKDSTSGGGGNPAPTTDSFTVTVNNGYGTGKYKTGDTVHIFSLAYNTDQLFNTWSSTDIPLLNGKDEWHTWFIMPAKNLSFTGSIKNITPVTLTFEQIPGRDRLKPVYYYFPAGHKGFVYLLHGTSGTAQHFVNSYEYQQLIKDLVSDNFGVIVSEAEEITLNTDLNGDGKLRWNNIPWDSVTNVDFANLRIITDTFYNRGVTNRSKFRYSAGMSNGGNFSASLSLMYSYKAGISYCAPAGNPIASVSTIPFQFCMARFDNNENVGPTGNANAFANSQTLTSRGICSKYFMQEHSPLYPERFARKGDITIAKSTAVFNELKTKGYLNNKNYFIGFSDVLTTAYQANPTSFPELNSLNILQKITVIEQIDLAVADHQMYSDYNRATVKFLNTQCN